MPAFSTRSASTPPAPGSPTCARCAATPDRSRFSLLELEDPPGADGEVEMIAPERHVGVAHEVAGVEVGEPLRRTSGQRGSVEDVAAALVGAEVEEPIHVNAVGDRLVEGETGLHAVGADLWF